MKNILKIICMVLAVLILCGAIGGVVYLFGGTDDPSVDEPTVDEPSDENPSDDNHSEENPSGEDEWQIILNEEGIAF